MAKQIIYYSMTGNTKRVCQQLAAQLDCSAEGILAPFEGKPGLLKILKLGYFALTRRKTRITAPSVRTAANDMLILGAQVWAGTLSTPMREFLATGPVLPDRVALVLTSGDPKYPAQAFDEFARLVGQRPVACLHVSEAEAKSDSFGSKLDEFRAALLQQGAA
ncbi:hypothetical protein LCL97_02210 [Seohaeicola saemankumensis]|nr:hypothetical protein [Seohaeicola saemankumensis]MCA0869629.1 hypothetical protein [Seohaeicola saemankumensis]